LSSKNRQDDNIRKKIKDLELSNEQLAKQMSEVNEMSQRLSQENVLLMKANDENQV